MDTAKVIHEVYKNFMKDCRQLFWRKNKWDIANVYFWTFFVTAFVGFGLARMHKDFSASVHLLQFLTGSHILGTITKVLRIIEGEYLFYIFVIVIPCVVSIVAGPKLMKRLILRKSWWKDNAKEYSRITDAVEFQLCAILDTRNPAEVACIFETIQTSSRATSRFNTLLKEIDRSRRISK